MPHSLGVAHTVQHGTKRSVGPTQPLLRLFVKVLLFNGHIIIVFVRRYILCLTEEKRVKKNLPKSTYIRVSMYTSACVQSEKHTQHIFREIVCACLYGGKLTKSSTIHDEIEW